MGKKIIGAIAFAAIAVAAGWNYKHNSQNVELSKLTLENIEALANGEGPDWQGFKTVYGPYKTCCQRDAYYEICSGTHQAC